MTTALEKKRAVDAAEDAVRKALEKVELAHWELDDATEAEHLARPWKQLIERAMCPVHEARHALKDLLEDLEEQSDVLSDAAEAEVADAHSRAVRTAEIDELCGRGVCAHYVEPDPASAEINKGGKP